MKLYFKYILLFVGMSVLFTACYKEDDIVAELAEDEKRPEPSDDPVDGYIYDFFKNYETYVFYNYDTLDYQWEFMDNHEVVFVEQSDRLLLEEGVNLLEAIFAGLYPDDFKKKHFPPYIFLADSINQTIYDGELNLASFKGTSFVALGRIGDNIADYTEEEIQEMKLSINLDLWRGYFVLNDKFKIPAEFGQVSEEYYGLNMLDHTGVDWWEDIDFYEYGFWKGYGKPIYWWYPSWLSDPYYSPNDVNEDLDAYFEMIFTHTESELLAMIDGYPKMKAKYNILMEYVENNYGFNLHDVAN
ncbi:hypothetical protein [Carboxylicivirga sp. RSCT41]|uniref:hypothetical protein n=1 Tax=Carboxylicivirga agarovorans TaxID=3417570 RepID=UPI003D339097